MGFWFKKKESNAATQRTSWLASILFLVLSVVSSVAAGAMEEPLLMVVAYGFLSIGALFGIKHYLGSRISSVFSKFNPAVS